MRKKNIKNRSFFFPFRSRSASRGDNCEIADETSAGQRRHTSQRRRQRHMRWPWQNWHWGAWRAAGCQEASQCQTLAVPRDVSIFSDRSSRDPTRHFCIRFIHWSSEIDLSRCSLPCLCNSYEWSSQTCILLKAKNYILLVLKTNCNVPRHSFRLIRYNSPCHYQTSTQTGSKQTWNTLLSRKIQNFNIKYSMFKFNEIFSQTGKCISRARCNHELFKTLVATSLPK